MFSKWENKTENLTILPRLLSKEQTSMHPQRSDTTASLCRHASHSQLVSVTLSNKQNFLCQSIYKQCWVSTVWEKTIPAKAVAHDLQANCSRDLTAVCRRPQLLCSYQKAGDDRHDTRSQTWMLLRSTLEELRDLMGAGLYCMSARIHRPHSFHVGSSMGRLQFQPNET